MRRFGYFLFIAFLLAILGKPAMADPTPQARYITINNVGTDTVRFSFTRGGGSGRIVVVRESAFDEDADFPSDGGGWSSGTTPFDYSSTEGKTNINGGLVVFNSANDGNVRVMTITGLTAGTTYYIGVFEFNGTDINPNPAVNNPRYFNTVPAPPGKGVATELSNTSFIANWNDPEEGFYDSYIFDAYLVNGTDTTVLDLYNQVDAFVNSSQMVEDLDPATMYVYRVKTVYGYKFSSWCDYQPVVTLNLPLFSGEANPCQGAEELYSLPADFDSYSWSVTGGTITPGEEELNAAHITWTDYGTQYISVDFVDSYGNMGTIYDTIDVRERPNFTLQPVDATICEDGTTSFTATAEGIPVLTYQWQVSTDGGSTWDDVPGETNTTLTLSNVTNDMNGNKYRLEAFNPCPTNISDEVTLTVNPLPVVSELVENLTVCENAGNNLTFTLEVGTAPFIVNYTINDGTSHTFSFTTDVGDGTTKTVPVDIYTNQYTVSVTGVTDANGCVGSALALPGDWIVNIQSLPTVSIDQGETIEYCADATMSLSATPTNESSVTWELVDYTGGGSLSSLTGNTTEFLPSVDEIQNGAVVTIRATANATAPCSDAVYDDIVLTVNPLPEVSVTANTPICSSETNSLTFNLTAGHSNWSNWTVVYFVGDISNTGTFTETYPNTTHVVTGVSGTADYTVGVISTTLDACTNLFETNTFAVVVYTSPAIAPENDLATITDVCEGQTTTIGVVATGTPAPTYQWQVSTDNGGTWGDVDGETSSSITLPGNPDMMDYLYRVKVTNTCNTIYSAETDLFIHTLPDFDNGTQPQDVTVCSGDAAIFSAEASDNGDAITYQWQEYVYSEAETAFVWQDIPGETNTTYTIGSPTTEMSGNPYRVIATTACGNDISNEVYLIVNPLPTLGITPESYTICAGSPNLITFDLLVGQAPWTAEVNINGTTSYTISDLSPTINVTGEVQSYTINVTSVTDDNGCTNTTPVSEFITVNPLPDLSITPDANPVCAGTPNTITFNLLTGTAPWVANVNINGGTTFTVSDLSPTISVTETDNYTINVTGITDDNGCVSTATTSQVITVNPLPVVTVIGTNSICAGQTNDVTFELTTGSGDWTVVYDVNDGVSHTGTFTESGIIHTLTVPEYASNYTVSVLSVEDGNLCQNTNTGSLAVQVNTKPLVTVEGPLGDICPGENPLSFTLTTGTPSWTVNYSVYDGTNTVTYSFTESEETTHVELITLAAASYTVDVISVTDNNCTNSDIGISTAYFDVNPAPVVNISSSGRVCANDNNEITFTLATGTPDWYVEYAISDGTITTTDSFYELTNTTHTVNISQTESYTVTVTFVSDYYCTSAEPSTHSVMVDPLPVVSITPAANPGCATIPNTITFDLTTGTSPWTATVNINDGSPFTVSDLSPTISVITGGSYTINVTSVTDDNGCTNTTPVSQVVMINPLPELSITPDANPVCSGSPNTITFALTAGLAPWTAIVNVNGGSTYTIDDLNPTISVTETNDYTINVVSVTDDNGCTNTTNALQTVTINPLPELSITPTLDPVCSGAENIITFALTTGTSPWTATGNINGGETFTINDITNTISVSQESTYTVNITSITDDNGCTNTTTYSQSVNVTPLPVVSVTPGNSERCANEANTLTFALTTGTPNWGVDYSITDGTVTTTASFSGIAETTYTVSVPIYTTNYTITVTNVTDANCSNTNTGSASVVVNPLPSTTITPDGPLAFCQGGSVTLTAPVNSSYSWSNGGTDQSITVSTGGTYNVTVVNSNGCTATSEDVTVTVYPTPALPTITPSGATTFCIGGSVTLTSSEASAYSWSTGETTQSIIVTASGDYTVTITDENGCNNTSAPTTVTVHQLPTTANAGPEATVGGKIGTLAGNTPSVGTGAWTLVSGPGTAAFSDASSPTSTATVSTFGDYVFRWTISNGTCTSSTSDVTIHFVDVPTKLVIATSIGLQKSGVPFSIVVQGKNEDDILTNVLTNTPITIGIYTGTGIVTGSGTMTAGSHQVTIAVTYTKVAGESGVVLKAMASGLTDGLSNAFNVTAAEPTDQAKTIAFNSLLCNTNVVSARISWYQGDGAYQLVLAKQGTSLTETPTDNTTYSANTAYGSGDAIGSAYVVYKGSAGTVTITGLTGGTPYTFKVFGFNGGAGLENYSLATGGSFNPRTRTMPSCKTSVLDIGTEIAGFVGNSYKKMTFLNWHSIYENNINGFEIYRSDIDNDNFIKIGSYTDNSTLASTGNRTTDKKYLFTDNDANLEVGKSYIYKLVSVGLDGTREDLSEVTVKINNTDNPNFELNVSEVTPNPVTDKIHFTMQLSSEQNVRIEILDMAGRKVSVPVDNKNYNSGIYNFDIPLENTASGVYMLNVVAGTESNSQKFIYMP